MSTGPRTLKPCGTRAAYQRHKRRGEEPCADCKRAEYRAEARRKANNYTRRVRPEEIRDPAVPYRYRAKRYLWAERVLAASEAEHGKPDDEVAA